MNNEQLILAQLLEIREDLGGVKSNQDSLDVRMTSLDKSMEVLENACSPFYFSLNKKQMVLVCGAFVTVITGLGAI